MNLQIEKFLESGGLKLLIAANLSRESYLVSLYLLNCALANIDEVIMADEDLSSMLDVPQHDIRQALEELEDKRLIKLRSSSPRAIRFELQTSSWNVGKTPTDALVFPFRKSPLHLMPSLPRSKRATWQRVWEAFYEGKGKVVEELNTQAAEALTEAYPVDQILLLIRHFKTRIPSLELLASNWHHYLELFEQERPRVDLEDARIRLKNVDESIRNAAMRTIESGGLSEQEVTVLQILIRHPHPRRQLFWAFQERSNYPKLADFFEEHRPLMLKITSSGRVLDWTDH